MTYAAKYHGICAKCGQPYAKGDSISWNRQPGRRELHHRVCPVQLTAPIVAPTPQISPAPQAFTVPVGAQHKPSDIANEVANAISRALPHIVIEFRFTGLNGVN